MRTTIPGRTMPNDCAIFTNDFQRPNRTRHQNKTAYDSIEAHRSVSFSFMEGSANFVSSNTNSLTCSADERSPLALQLQHIAAFMDNHLITDNNQSSTISDNKTLAALAGVMYQQHPSTTIFVALSTNGTMAAPGLTTLRIQTKTRRPRMSQKKLSQRSPTTPVRSSAEI